MNKTRHRGRGVLRLAAASCASVLLVAGVTPTARADTPACSIQYHCASVLIAGDDNAGLYAGMYGTWNRAAMYASCTATAHRFITSEMWLNPISGHGWVEIGHVGGWMDPPADCDYYAFMAWQRKDGSGYSEHVFSRLNHNDTVTDEFQISHAATSNVFYGYFNGSRFPTVNVQFWNSRRLQMGGEVATAYGSSHTFNMTGRGINQAGSRVLMPTPQQEWVDPSLFGDKPANSAWTWRIPA